MLNDEVIKSFSTGRVIVRPIKLFSQDSRGYLSGRKDGRYGFFSAEEHVLVGVVL